MTRCPMWHALYIRRCCGCARRSRREFDFGLGGPAPGGRKGKGPRGAFMGDWPQTKPGEKGGKCALFLHWCRHAVLYYWH